MNPETGMINLEWARFAVKILTHSGVRHVCLSPGSRNSPLTIAFTENPAVTCTRHMDERSAGYFALGMAKASEYPVALCCTSGTAAANYLPAVVEANYSRVPLIVITADRPGRLVGTGANQTIHQKNLFGVHVRYFRDVGAPAVRTLDLNQFFISAILMAMGMNSKGERINPQGPVHLNFPFDEPLHPPVINPPQPGADHEPPLTLPAPNYTDLIPTREFSPASHGVLIVCGRMEPATGQDSVLPLSERLYAPIFTDVTSQLRFGQIHPNVICFYDLFLKVTDIVPEQVIRFGAKPTSKILCQKLDEWKDRTILVDPAGRFNDDCSTVIPCRISTFVRSISPPAGDHRPAVDWLQRIRDINMATHQTVVKYLDSQPLFEATVVTACIKSLVRGDHLFLGNSMPVRDADGYMENLETDIRVHVNRGASGIDGCTSTAAGIGFYASTKAHITPGNRTFLISGDVSFFYDINALHSAKRLGIDLTVIVINNGGGGIFSFLPVAISGVKGFDEYWTTPPMISIETMASVFGCAFFRADSATGIRDAIAESRRLKGMVIIEVRTEIADNVRRHAQVMNFLRQKLTGK